MPALRSNSQVSTNNGKKTSRLLLPKLLLFLVAATINLLIYRTIASLDNIEADGGGSSSSEAEQLRQRIRETSLRIKKLEASKKNGNVGNLDTPMHEAQPDVTTSVKNLFNDLSEATDTQMKPTILENLVPRQGGSLDRNDIVMATHLSTSKFSQLLVQLKYWNGPTSAAVYISSLKDVDDFFAFINQHGPQVNQTSFHLVLEKTKSLPYPFNILRQVALETVESYYFVAMDVDLIPLPLNCHDKLLETFTKINDLNRKQTLFVLPAFSLTMEKNETTSANENRLPLSRDNVVALAKKKKLIQFQKKKSGGGHAPSNYKKWLSKANDAHDLITYEINVTKKESIKYEPYVIGFKPGIPRYWEGKTTFLFGFSADVGAFFSLSFLITFFQ